MPKFKLLPDLLKSSTDIGLTNISHPISSEIFRQLRSHTNLKVTPQRVDSLSQADIFIHLGGFGPPSLSETLSLTADLDTLARHCLRHRAKLILVLPVPSSPLKSTAVSMVTQYSRFKKLDHVILEVDSQKPPSQTAQLIIKKFVYRHLVIPSTANIKVRTRPLPKARRRHPPLKLPSLPRVGLSISKLLWLLLVPLLVVGYWALTYLSFNCSLRLSSLCLFVARPTWSLLSFQSGVFPGVSQLSENLGQPIQLSTDLISRLSSYQQADTRLDTVSLKLLTKLFSGKNQPENFSDFKKSFNDALVQLSLLQTSASQLYQNSTRPSSDLVYLAGSLSQSRREFSMAQKMVAELETLLSQSESQTLALVIQDSNELRPAGGLIDSVFILSVQSGKLVDVLVLPVSAVVSPRGQVTPPQPLQKHLGSDDWAFSDANWSPDPPEAAGRVAWFLDKSQNQRVGSVVFLTSRGVASLLQATGAVSVGDQKISPANFMDQYYLSLQSPDSKNLFISQVVESIIARLNQAPQGILQKLLDQLPRLALSRDLVFVSLLDSSQSGLQPVPCLTSACDTAVFAAYDANLGLNKVNSQVTTARDFTYELNSKGETLALTSRYTNNSTAEKWPLGSYRNYFQVYMPPEYYLDEVKVGDTVLSAQQYSVAKSPRFLTVGFLLNIAPGQTQTVTVRGRRFLNLSGRFELNYLIPNQPGLSLSQSVKIVYPREWFVTTTTEPQVATSGSLGYNLESFLEPLEIRLNLFTNQP